MTQPTTPSFSDARPTARTDAVPPRRDFESVLATRAELGSEMQPALVDSFASQITDEIRRQMGNVPRPVKPPSAGPSLALGIVSVVMLIPITAIALALHAPWMMFFLLPTIVVINLALAWSQRRG